ncbi:MAG: hypothetical protein BWY78_01437 [Alphaproteobacteria bacterium ADurb.Bin438]|nr:MAG: hypothetical protein BWY78_01437 [Alphaproteobacteria bacterium ADurb.Bin438]
MLNQKKTERLISFKIPEEMYLRVEKHSNKVGVSVQECILDLLTEQLDNIETYYKMLEIDEDMEKISLVSNDKI